MQARTFLTASGITPPSPAEIASSFANLETNDGGLEPSFQPKTSNNSSTNGSNCRRLLNLIRSLEKKEKDHDETYEGVMQDTVELLNHLIALYSCHGLLVGNAQKAENILATQSQTMDGGRRGNKKGNKVNISKAASNDHDLSIVARQQESSEDESLIFTAVLRVLPPTANLESSKEGNNSKLDNDQALLISLVSELCVAITQRIIQEMDTTESTCAVAEYELLAQFGKQILAGLVTTMQLVALDIVARNLPGKLGAGYSMECCLTLVRLCDLVHIQTLNSAMKAAGSLVTLFGTKLSRSTSLLLDLHTQSLRFLTVSDSSVQESAARLLSLLPLAGGVDRKSPSDLWNIQVSDILSALSRVLEAVAPLANNNNSGSVEGFPGRDSTTKTPTATMVDNWVHFVRRKLSDESARLKCFYQFTRGLTKAICCLLLQEGLGNPASNASLVDVEVDIQRILGVVESLVSFPLSAETVYYKTKKRLRDEVVDNGLLSPRVIATQIANSIKELGHDILDCSLAAMGGPTLLPYARRIIRICYASILTSCSGPVRKIMDPSSVAQLEGKKRRWLHLSIAMRARSIKSVESIIAAFGSDNSGSGASFFVSRLSGRSATASTDGERAIALVVGCFVEQISTKKTAMGDFDVDWGNYEDRMHLIVASSNCLSTSMMSCGGYLPFKMHSLIESAAKTALSVLNKAHQTPLQILTWAPVKISILQLGRNCVATPCPDGASSLLVELLAATAKGLENDMDLGVSLAAKSALRLCDTVCVPRAPALLYISRAVDSSSNNQGDISSLAKDLEFARDEAKQAKLRAEEADASQREQAKAKRRLRDETRQEKSSNGKKLPSNKKIRTQLTKDEDSFTVDAAAKLEKPGNSALGEEEEQVLRQEAEEDTSLPEVSDKVEVRNNKEAKEQGAEEGEEDDGLPEIFAGDGPDVSD